MKNRIACFSVGVLLSAAAAVIAVADPIPFPEEGPYKTDFEDDPEAAGWTFESWLWDFIPDGVEELSAVRPSEPSALDDFAFAEDGLEFPIEPLVPAGNYREFGFSGDNWLVNAAGVADEDGVIVGTALLELTDLPPHASISLAMKLAVGGSIDGDDGPFEVQVDDTTVFSFGFGSGGGGLTGAGVTRLATGANLTTLYQEQWNDGGGAGPSSETDRFTIAWTLDSAYDIAGFSPFTEIPHTSDDLSIRFLHHLSSGAGDEHVAIDDLVITLGEVAPPPPNEWPGGDTYSEDFSPVSKAWTLLQWANVELESGVEMMTGSGNGPGLVRRTADDTGFGEEAFQEEGVPVFPLEPIIEAQSYTDIDPRFAGDWLQTTGSATHNGTATLFFENLPPHDGLDIDFVLAASDSFPDGDDVIPDIEEAGNFQILVDGESVLVANAKSTVNGLVEELVSGANLSFNYREDWIDIDEGPETAADRTAIGWTLDNAYDWTTIFDPDGEIPIAHTAETLTLTLVHGLNSSAADEAIAIDSFVLKLLNVTEKVEFSITSLLINDETNAVTITWPSASNKTYGVDRSFNLQAWDELADGVAADGTETAYVDDTVPAGTREAYYRVRLE